MAIEFLTNINLEAATDIQFKNAAGTNTGKIESDGNNLVLSNAVGDILLGDGASDVYIGDGTNSVDILFEVSGSISAESGAALTLGGAGGTLALGSALALGGNNLTGGGTITGTTLTGTSLDINGAADISGALTGVDAITMNGALSGTTTIVASGKIQGAELEGTSLDINGSADISGNLTGVDSITASATVQAEHLYSTDDLVVADDASVGGDLTVDGTTYGIYHSYLEDGYYHDDYNGSRNLSIFYKNARADLYNKHNKWLANTGYDMDAN